MTIDHVGFFLFSQIIVLRWIGRLSAPLFIFCLVEGLKHTGDKKRYLVRLYVASVVMPTMGTVFSLVTGVTSTITLFNIFSTMFLVGVITLIIDYKRDFNPMYKRLILLFAVQQIAVLVLIIVLGSTEFGKKVEFSMCINIFNAIMPSVMTCEGSVVMVGIGIVMYLSKNIKETVKNYFLFTSIYAIISYFSAQNISEFMLMYYQWLMVFSAPIMLLYNGEKGRSNRWIFYVYYPLHVYFLAYVALIII